MPWEDTASEASTPPPVTPDFTITSLPERRGSKGKKSKASKKKVDETEEEAMDEDIEEEYEEEEDM